MINVEQWRKCAKGVFNSIIIIMLCSVIGNVFSVIGNVQNALSALQDLASNNSVDMGLSTIGHPGNNMHLIGYFQLCNVFI